MAFEIPSEGWEVMVDIRESLREKRRLLPDF
jgi:hypothetical protein